MLVFMFLANCIRLKKILLGIEVLFICAPLSNAGQYFGDLKLGK